MRGRLVEGGQKCIVIPRISPSMGAQVDDSENILMDEQGREEFDNF